MAGGKTVYFDDHVPTCSAASDVAETFEVLAKTCGNVQSTMVPPCR